MGNEGDETTHLVATERKIVPDDLTRLIEKWFAECGDDQADFVYPLQATPYTVIGPSEKPGRIIFATKPAIVVKAIEGCAAARDLDLIGRYGLPSEADVQWIRDVVGQCALSFLGDLDPPDLMIFAWLRARLHPKRIAHLGVNDAFLASLQLCLPATFCMPLAPLELKSRDVLSRAFPDMEDLVGSHCNETVLRGLKIELEAVVSAKGDVGSILLPALDGGM